jgi:proline dehydrogenase
VAETPNLGVAVQAYLRRSRADVEKLIADGVAHVRLVKGAYAEPAEIVFEKSATVQREYRQLMRLLLEPASIKAGTTVAVATHDAKLLAEARTRTFRKATPEGRWEVQMLLGVRTSQQKRLLGEGYPVRVYLPYGRHWYAYSMRRLAERPANLVFALRSIFSS